MTRPLVRRTQSMATTTTTTAVSGPPQRQQRLGLASLYHGGDTRRPRYSWVRDPSVKILLGKESHGVPLESDGLLKSQISALAEGDEESDEEVPAEEIASGDDYLVVDDDSDFGPVSKQEIHWARAYLLFASLLYGTSFPLIKILDDNMPFEISVILRFGLASLVTLPWLFDAPSQNVGTSISACWCGVELGMWNLIGALSQTIALVTTPANKVYTAVRSVISRQLPCFGRRIISTHFLIGTGCVRVLAGRGGGSLP